MRILVIVGGTLLTVGIAVVWVLLRATANRERAAEQMK